MKNKNSNRNIKSYTTCIDIYIQQINNMEFSDIIMEFSDIIINIYYFNLMIF